MIEESAPVLPGTPAKVREGKPSSHCRFTGGYALPGEHPANVGSAGQSAAGKRLLLTEFRLIFALALAQMAYRLIDLAAS